MKLTRRQMMVRSLGVMGAAAAAGDALAQVACLKLTPQQPEGPFYPINDQLDKDTDLTRLTGAQALAKGQLIYVKGTVSDQSCVPVAGVLVEIWQACSSGKYNHKGDPNPAPLDPNFQYWGRAVTAANGSYVFKTILPGAYPASNTWMRPPHIHFKVAKVGYRELITQLYFAGEEFNDTDLILKEIPVGDRSKVVVPLKNPDSDFDPSSKIATFDLTIRKVKSPFEP